MRFPFRRPVQRLPVCLQMEASECGLACLAMLGGYHGLGRSLAQLRLDLPVSRKGVSVLGLVRMAEALGLTPRPVKLDLDGLPQLQLPCILHWNMDHFVVLRSITRRGAVIHDPAVGVCQVTMEELGHRFTGVAMMCEPGPRFVAQPPQAAPSLRRWLGPVRGFVRPVAKILAATVALEALAVVMPMLLQWVVDDGLPHGDRRLIDGLVVGFGLLVVASAALDVVRGWMITLFSTRLNLGWMKRVLAHLLRLPLAYFERRHVGDVATSFASITVIQQTLTHRFVAAVVDGLMSVGTLAMLACVSPPGALVALAMLAAHALVRWLFQRSLRQGTAEQIVHAARQQSHFLESLRGMQGLRLYGRAAHRLRDWSRLVEREMDADRRVGALHGSHSAASRALSGLQRVGVVWLAAQAVLAGDATLGAMFAFLTYLDQFSRRGTALVDCAFDLALLRLHLDRVGDIVHTPAETRTPPRIGAAGPDALGPLAVSVRAVTFAYAFAEPAILHGVELDVKAGECVALAGPSGCGKTTLVKLLLGLHAPDSGEIFVNGQPLESFGRDRLRSMVGTVMQDDILFTGSLAENISFFDAGADAAWIEACARMAAVHDDIVAMPMGYATLVGEAGTGLSGGQKQRLMLARALYRRPRLLVLDEATSHLDIHSEQLVNDAVRRLAVTRIVVAHRPQTLAMADRVVTLAAGRVVPTSGHATERPAVPSWAAG